MDRNLVLVRAGDASLHRSWLEAEQQDRGWDLHISYFGSRETPYGALPPGVSLSYEQGPKYSGLAACLRAHPEFLERYRFIALPDDDLQASRGAWADVFRVMEETGALLGQPSLDPRSFISHEITLQRPAFRYREVNFVEVMAPVFRADLLRDVLGLFLENESSWGLDYLFAEKVRKLGGKMVIVDEASFLHTRRVGKGTQYKPGGVAPSEDMHATLARHGVMNYPGRSLRAVRRDGTATSWLINKRVYKARLYRAMVRILGLNTITA